MSILPSIWMDNRLPLCSSSTFFPSSRFVRGTFRGVGWGGGGEKGGDGARRGGASECCHRVSHRPLRPSAGGVGAQRSARQRARRVGTRECGFLASCGHPKRAGRLSSARSPEPGAGRPPPPVRWAAAPAAAARLPGSAPRHGVIAQRRRDGGGGGGGGSARGFLVQRGGGASPREEGPPARRHPLYALPGGGHLPLPQHFRAGTG